MFIIKKKYYLLIENIKDLELKNIKITNKYTIIYRNIKKGENINKILLFRKKCKAKKIDFYVANNIKKAVLLKADGLYVSAYNNRLNLAPLKNLNIRIVGSAHNLKELNTKILQGCSDIFFSRLFLTNYKNKKGFLGLIRFNLFALSRRENLIPLGGIKQSNLNKLKIVKCNSAAFLSEAKKKPAILFSRLF